ncbi:hypothetical protein Hanom_Chr07g00621781 [Helianthus anomalus]
MTLDNKRFFKQETDEVNLLSEVGPRQNVVGNGQNTLYLKFWKQNKHFFHLFDSPVQAYINFFSHFRYALSN